jgi:hypothetical protein
MPWRNSEPQLGSRKSSLDLPSHTTTDGAEKRVDPIRVVENLEPKTKRAVRRTRAHQHPLLSLNPDRSESRAEGKSRRYLSGRLLLADKAVKLGGRANVKVHIDSP